MSYKIYPLLLILASTFAKASEIPKQNTTIEAEIGLLATSGNTETASFKGKFDIRQNLNNLKNHFVLEGLSRKDKVTEDIDGESREFQRFTAEKYFSSWQTDFKMRRKDQGIFVFGSHEADRFSGFKFQSTLASGYTDRLCSFINGYLDSSVGPAVVFSETSSSTNEDNKEIGGESRTNFAIRVAFSHLYQISKTAKFTQTFASELAPKGKNTKTKAETAITANMTSNVALKASFTFDQNTHPGENTKNTDTHTAVTVVVYM